MTPFGDRAVLFELPSGPRGALLARLRATAEVRDVVLAETTGLVVFEDACPTEALTAALAAPFAAEETSPRLHRIPVVYDGADLVEVAERLGFSTAEVVRLHAEPEYRVALVGFAPGFAYLRGIAPELVLPRRAPRPRVPAGSVAFAAGYSGVYPFASPGGWHLLGHAPGYAAFVDGAAVLALDDRVRFEAAEGPPAIEAAPAVTPTVTGPYLELTRVMGVAFLVDGGRQGRMHDGIPPGGPLVRGGLVGANRHAGNADLACGLELYGTFEVTARGGTVTVAAAEPIVLADGASYRIATGAARVTYLAVLGGIDAPVVLGGRGVFRIAGTGGPLRRGARLAIGDASAAPMPPRDATRQRSHEPVPLLPGPDGDVHAHLRELTISAASDRTGVRLDGYAGPTLDVPRDRRSIPMTIGAMELTPSGPIVLGPDHPTTGGYPVVGIVPSGSLDAFFARPVGARVSFRPS